METKGPRPSVVSYSSVCSALRGLGDWANALQLLKRAQEQQVPPGVSELRGSLMFFAGFLCGFLW
jgi:hypothetical protein